MVSTFTPEVDVINVKSRPNVKRIAVVSPFSPFLQFTPDYKEIWMTHKDVGKVTRIDTHSLKITGSSTPASSPITSALQKSAADLRLCVSR